MTELIINYTDKNDSNRAQLKVFSYTKKPSAEIQKKLEAVYKGRPANEGRGGFQTSDEGRRGGL